MKNAYPMAIVTAPGKIEFEDWTLPSLGDHDVLLRVRATTICGGDLHIFRGKHPAAPLPAAIGHEIAGEVLEVGPSVTRVQIGDRVAIEPVIACGKCHFCRRGAYHLCTDISFQYRVGQGGFTPYFVAPEGWVHRVPPHLSYGEGALLEPLSVALHAVTKAGPRFGQSSAIFGAGAIGLLVLLLLRSAGGGQTFVVDIQDFRLRKARELGASSVFNNLNGDAVREILDRTGQLGVDTSFEAVGVEVTLLQCLQALKKGGTAVLVGLFEEPTFTLPANIFVQKEITLSGSQGYNWDFQAAHQLLEQRRLDLAPLVTHEYPLAEVQQAFDLLMDPQAEAIKVAICQ
jgi:2-desacetyl-2-hydroxyethyl bacteriochlorophyllide A dehydrogenase